MHTRTLPASSNLLGITITTEQGTQIFRDYSHSSTRSLSAYVRTFLIKGPVTVRYRNRPSDDPMHEMIGIKEVLWQVRKCFARQLQSFHQVSTSSKLERWARIQEKAIVPCLLPLNHWVSSW